MSGEMGDKNPIRENAVIGFSKMWCWVVITMVIMFAADVTMVSAQTNDAPVSQETNSPTNTSKTDTPPKVESQREAPTSPSPTVDIDPAIEIKLQQFFNELSKEYLAMRSQSTDWWLKFVVIVFVFLGVVIPIAIAIISYFGHNRIRKIELYARRNVEEIRALRALSVVHMRKMTRIDIDDPCKTTEDEEAIRDVQSDPVPSLVDKAIADIYTLQEENEIEDAIEKWHFIANIAEGADDNLAARVWASIGYLYGEENNYEKSLSAYDTAIRLKPDFAKAYNNRGITKTNLSEYESAIADYSEAIRLNPDDSKAYSNRGVAKANLGHHESAIADYNETIRLKPNLAEAYSNRGVAKANLGHHESALADCDEAIRLEPDLAEAYSNRSTVKRILGEYKSAQGNAELALGHYKSALADCDEAIRLKPGLVDAYINRGVAHVDLQNIEDARIDFQTALELARQQDQENLEAEIKQRLQKLDG